MSKKLTLTAFHGTSIKNKNAIVRTSFQASTKAKNQEWLGNGVYFFIEGNGLMAPKGAALKWAIAESWNNKIKRYMASSVAVIEAEIELEKDVYLDLREPDNRAVYNEFRNRAIQLIAQRKFKIDRRFEYCDGRMIDFLIEKVLKLKPPVAVVAEFFFQFSDERKYQVNCRLPNCTVLTVKDPSAIKIKSHQEIPFTR